MKCYLDEDERYPYYSVSQPMDSGNWDLEDNVYKTVKKVQDLNDIQQNFLFALHEGDGLLASQIFEKLEAAIKDLSK